MAGIDWNAMNTSIRATQFERCYTWPLAWKSASYNLKHAADHLFAIYHDAKLRIIQGVIEDAEASRAGIPQAESRMLEGQELLDHQDGSLISVYFLLSGYAIENLLKGLLMLQHPEYFKPDSKIVSIRNHNLVNLCQRCGFAISAEEKVLLENLTEHIEWMGKYPAPLEIGKAYPKRLPDGTWGHGGHAFNGTTIRDDIDRLYGRLHEELTRQDKAIKAAGTENSDAS